MVESLEQEIAELRSLLRSARAPEGRAVVPQADAYRRARDLAAALTVIEEGLASHPSLASAHVVRAWIHQDRGDREAAIASFRQVLELDGENVEGLRGLGVLYLEAGRPDDARPLLHRARALDPDETSVQARSPAVAERAATPPEPAPLEAAAEGLMDAHGGFAVEPTSEAGVEPDANTEAVLETTASPELSLEPAEETATLPELSLEPAEETATLPERSPEPAEETATLPELSPEPAGEGPVAVELSPEPEVDPLRVEAEVEHEVAIPALEGEAEAIPTTGDEEAPVLAAAAEALLSAQDRVEREAEPPELPPTRTLAEVFARQGLVERAAQIYQRLLEERPGDGELEARLRELRLAQGAGAGAGQDLGETSWDDEETEALALEMSRSTGAPGELSTPFAWAEERTAVGQETGEPIRTYFQRLLSWEPGDAGGGPSQPAAPTSEAPSAEASAGALGVPSGARSSPPAEDRPPKPLETAFEPAEADVGGVIDDALVDVAEGEAAPRPDALIEQMWDEPVAIDSLAPAPQQAPEPTQVTASAPDAAVEPPEDAAVDRGAAFELEDLHGLGAPSGEEPEQEIEVAGEEVPSSPVEAGSAEAPVAGAVPIESLATDAVTGAPAEPEQLPGVVEFESPAPEAVTEAPAAPEPAYEVVDVESLAPDAVTEAPAEPEQLPEVVEFESPAPDAVEAVTEASAAPEPAYEVVDVESLAPDAEAPAAPASAEVVDIETLAPAGATLEVVPIGSLAPGPVVPIEALAPGPVVPVAWLAPGPVVPIEWLAPAPVVAVEVPEPGRGLPGASGH